MTRTFKRVQGVVFTSLVVAALAVLSAVTIAANPAERTNLSPTRKPGPKSEGKGVTRGALLYSKDVSAEKMTRSFGTRQVSLAIQIPLAIDVYDSWDAKSDVSNDVVVLDVAGLAGLGSGNPATMTGVGWDVTIDTASAPAGASWLSEAVIEFDENASPGTNWIALTPGVLDDFAGVGTYSSGGIVLRERALQRRPTNTPLKRSRRSR